MEFEKEIIKQYGTFSRSESGWTKEVNLISWNNKKPKIDIRSWDADHDKSAKIATFTPEEVRLLSEVLASIDYEELE